jgi:ribonuclease P protein component
VDERCWPVAAPRAANAFPCGQVTAINNTQQQDRSGPTAARSENISGFQRFPKQRRILRPAEFQEVYKSGIRRSTRHFVVFVLAQTGKDGALTRVGITVGRKLGSAVIRNRIRRRTREIVRRHWKELGREWLIVINPRGAMLEASFATLEQELITELQRLCGRPH